MTTSFRAHFDGKVIVPDEPVDLPVNEPLQVQLGDVPAEETWRIPHDPLEGLSIEEKRARFRQASGRLEGVHLPEDALRRENWYE